VIEQTEAAFAQIRRQNKNLAKIRRYLRDMHAAEEMLAELERTAAHV
jgi:predicted RNA polymerase sigma factor